MNKNFYREYFKEYFAGTDIIDRFAKSPAPVTKFKGEHRPFGYYDGKLYVGPRGSDVSIIVTDDGIKNHVENWKFTGKIYDRHHIIQLPKPPKNMTLFIRELEQAFNFARPIVISPEWGIKINGMKAFRLRDYKKNMGKTPKIRYTTKEASYPSYDQAIRKHVDPPIGSDTEIELTPADELGIVEFSRNELNPNVIKKRILKYKLLGGSLEGIFQVIKAKVETSAQKGVLRDLQNYYLEGQKFARSGWRRNDLRETYGVGAMQLRGSDNAIYLDIENDEFIKLGILDKFSNIKADAWIYSDEIDKLIQYLEQAKKDLGSIKNNMNHQGTHLRQGF